MSLDLLAPYFFIKGNTVMTKSLLFLTSKSWLAIPSFAMLLINQAAIASDSSMKSIDEVETKEIAVSVKGQKVCAKHPKVSELFCTNLEQVLQLKKGVAMIDLADSNDQDALLRITNEESDAAIATFGCDCAVSINRLRHMRNMLP
jgi:hypothetical protein